MNSPDHNNLAYPGEFLLHTFGYNTYNTICLHVLDYLI